MMQFSDKRCLPFHTARPSSKESLLRLSFEQKVVWRHSLSNG
jgi:hypothetical protein